MGVLNIDGKNVKVSEWLEEFPWHRQEDETYDNIKN